MSATTAVQGIYTKFKFPWLCGILMCAALLAAEHHFPSEVMYDSTLNSQIDSQLAGMKSSLAHEISYLFLGSLGFFWFIWHRQRLIRWRTAIPITLIAILMWCSVSIAWAQDPMVSSKRLAAFVLMIIGAAGTAAYWPRTTIVSFISICSAVHLTIGVIGELAAAHFTPWEAGYRFAGTLPWNQQGFCCLVLALSSLAAMDATPRYKQIFRLLFVYGIVFLVLTKSRSSLMALLIGLIIYFLLTSSARFHFGLVLSLGLTTMLLYLTGVTGGIWDVISRNGEGSEDLTGRIPLWKECFGFIRARPVTGYGYQDFWTSSHIYYFASELHWGVSSAHSSYIESLLMVGAVGLVLQILVLLLGFGRGIVLYKRSRNPIYALAACLCLIYLLVGTLESIQVAILSPYSFYFFLLLLTLCMNDIQHGPDRLATAIRPTTKFSPIRVPAKPLRVCSPP